MLEQRDSSLARAEAAWNEVLAFVDSLAPAIREGVRSADGWSAKDHIAHIAAWKRSFVLWLGGMSGHEVLGIPEEMFLRDDLDEINAAILEVNRDRPWVEVRADAIAAHEAWLTALASQPAERLQARLGNETLIDSIPDLTWEHDEEHLHSMRELIGAKPHLHA